MLLESIAILVVLLLCTLAGHANKLMMKTPPAYDVIMLMQLCLLRKNPKTFKQSKILALAPPPNHLEYKEQHVRKQYMLIVFSF